MNLQQQYNRDDFLVFLKSFVPKYEKDIRRIAINALHVTKEAMYLGKSPELDLEIFELTHSSSSDARISLAMDGFKVMKHSATYRALVIYRADKGDDWRLSLMTATPGISEKGKIVQSLSNPRRFSFFLGPNAKVNTPYQFLVRQGPVKDFDELQKRFSLEVVNKEFYTKISESFTRLVGGALGSGKNANTYKAMLKLPSVPEQSKVNKEFAVRLIGRVIFCWFLREKISSTGKALMPKDLLSYDAIVKYLDYYHNILEPIFFEVLDKEIKSREKPYSSEPFSLIPYLNGGLFSPHDDYYKRNGGVQSIYYNTLVIPDQWFLDLFKTLETYNFTIDENTSFDEELSIDPEMLGRIFENLLAEINPETGESARKSTGSYYTPRTIVDYMVDESLLHYLKQQTNIDESKLRALISYDLNDDLEHPLNQDEKQRIIDALEKLKLLDPACGSGAFPIGALQKIVFILQQADPDGQLWFKKQIKSVSPEIRRVIEREFAHKNFNYIRKLGIIRENIYGVDIQPIATEISRLRCFLTLVVDERVDDSLGNRGIEPLPNLDFKFVTANSLTGLPSDQQTNMFEDQTSIDQLKDLRDQFFNATNSERYQLKKEFKEIKERMSLRMIEMSGGEELTRKLSTWDPFSHDSTNWFDPEWMFGIKDGFDIVIANPPYISVEKFARTSLQSEWKRKFKTFAARGDIYCFFYEQGLNLLRNGGALVFISSNKFQRAGYGKRLRQLLVSQRIHTLIDFCELPVFAASTDPMIVIVSKSVVPQNHEFNVLVVKDEAEISSLPQSIKSRASRYRPEQLKDEGWSLEGELGLVLVDKFRSKGTPLGEYVNNRFYRGILTGLNEAFIIDRATRDRLIHEDRKSAELIKPWIRGKDIKRWHYCWNELYLIQIASSENVRHPWSEKSKKAASEVFKKTYPAIARHLLSFEQKLNKRTDKGTHFWELRSCDYWESFGQLKIVFNETSKRLHAYLDTEGNTINKTGFIILTPEAPFVLAVLNSTPMDWLYRSTFPSWGDPWNSGRIQFRGDRMNQVPIPPASTDDKSRLTNLARRAAEYAAAGAGDALAKVEQEIDEIVYRLFDLNSSEITQIETSLINTRSESYNDDEEDE